MLAGDSYKDRSAACVRYFAEAPPRKTRKTNGVQEFFMTWHTTGSKQRACDPSGPRGTKMLATNG
jgi:hypothetical protein